MLVVVNMFGEPLLLLRKAGWDQLRAAKSKSKTLVLSWSHENYSIGIIN